MKDSKKSQPVGRVGGWTDSQVPAIPNEPLPETELGNIIMTPGWGWGGSELSLDAFSHLKEKVGQNLQVDRCPGFESHGFELEKGEMVCHRCGARLCKVCKGTGEIPTAPTPPHIEYDSCLSCGGKGVL